MLGSILRKTIGPLVRKEIAIRNEANRQLISPSTIWFLGVAGSCAEGSDMADHIDLWPWFDGEYKVHCPDRGIYDKIMRWKGSRPGGIYYIPGQPNEYDVIIPEAYLGRVQKLLKASSMETAQMRNKTEPQTPELPADPPLKDNELRETESPLRHFSKEDSI